MRELLHVMRKLDAGAPSLEVLRAFVTGQEFPLVEGGQATFFFWDGKPADDVYLIHWVFGLESRQPFLRIPGSEAFYLPLELPAGSRVEYKLEVVRKGHHSWIRDPLNPRRAYDPFGSNSVCPMPPYQDPPWVNREPLVKRGRIEELTLRTTAWGEERVVRVYLPAEYKARKRHPVLIVHDGDDYLKFAQMDQVLDTLIHRNEVMPMVVAFTSGGPTRNEQYAANERQASYLVHDLLPALSKVYGISDDPRERGLMGASFGAVSSLFTAWTHPGVFGNLLLQSGSFIFTEVGHHGRPPLWDPIVKFTNAFRDDPGRLAARMFLSCGTFESLIYYNRSLVPKLRAAGLQVKFVESRDGHNWVNWRDRLRDGLTFLYPGRLRMIYE